MVDDPHRRPGAVHLAAVVIAVLGISSSAVLVRWAEAPAVVLALLRCAGGAALLLPFGRTAVTGRHHRRLAVAGLALAVHFSAWLASLELTTVAASVTLVTTAPVFVALIGWVRGVPVGGRRWAGIGLAVVGSAIIAGGDLGRGGDAVLGDALALVGAMAMAAYLVVGESVRAELDVAAYAGRAYAVAAFALGPVVLVADLPVWGFDRTTWLAIGAMILGPQLAGHTLLNGLLATFGSVTISLLLLLEPLGAGVLVWLAFGETPPAEVWLGAPVVLAGLAVATTARRSISAAPAC